MREPLLSVVERLSFARSLAEVTGILRTAARQLTGADGATVVLREGASCFYADEDAIAPLWKGRRFPIEQCISGWVMIHGVPAAIADVYADPRIPHDAYRPTFVKSLLMVPVRPPQAQAAIGVYWAAMHAPSADQIAVASRLADTAAIAFATLRRHDDLQQSLERETNARIAAEDSAALKDQCLATLSHELRTALNVILKWAWQLQRTPLPDSAARAVDAIEQTAAAQLGSIEDVLAARSASTPAAPAPDSTTSASTP